MYFLPQASLFANNYFLDFLGRFPLFLLVCTSFQVLKPTSIICDDPLLRTSTAASYHAAYNRGTAGAKRLASAMAYCNVR